MQPIIPKIAVGITSSIEMSLSQRCVAEPALAQDLETDCCLMRVTVWIVLCKKNPARSFEKTENISWTRREWLRHAPPMSQGTD